VSGAYDLDREGLAELLADQPPYRVAQVWRGLYRGLRRPGEMTDLPPGLRDRLEAALPPALSQLGSSVADGGDTERRSAPPDSSGQGKSAGNVRS
jgi:adenine C2-methylase RlmN of 23S rRNA A2503 and tRNA A37